MKLVLTIVLFLVLTACASGKSTHCDAYGSNENVVILDTCSK
jgi:hypothetical protein